MRPRKHGPRLPNCPPGRSPMSGELVPGPPEGLGSSCVTLPNTKYLHRSMCGLGWVAKLSPRKCIDFREGVHAYPDMPGGPQQSLKIFGLRKFLGGLGWWVSKMSPRDSGPFAGSHFPALPFSPMKNSNVHKTVPGPILENLVQAHFSN